MKDVFNEEDWSTDSPGDFWWKGQNNFFGDNYLMGDNSQEGFIPGKKETLEERTDREIQGIINVLNISNAQAPLRILDAPCGYGRHSLALAKKREQMSSIGHVYGVDINEIHLQKAINDARKAFGEKWKQYIDFSRMDMRQINKLRMLSEPIKFDIVLNMFFSFGFFQQEEENKKLMQRFYEVLREDGRLLLHTDVCVDMIEQGKYRFDEIRNLVSGQKLVIAENYDPQTKRLNGRWLILDDKKGEVLSTKDYSVRIYSKEEYVNMAKECGFREVKTYGAFNKDRFTPASPELIMLATKY